MAIYHTRIKTYSRSKGHSAIAAAAYRGGYLLTDPRSGARHDYRGRAGIIQSRCIAPTGSPAWADDPQALWTAAEAAERRCNSTVCRNFAIALPHELDDPKRWELVLDIAHRLIERFGFALQASHHRPTKDDPRYFYAHLLATTRRMEASGLTAKTRVLDGRINGLAEIQWIRAMIADRINAHLAEAGIGKAVEHRSLTERLEVTQGNGIFVRGQAHFEQLLSRYRQEGRLLSVPDGHTAEQAQQERPGPGMDTSADETSLAKMPIMPASVGRLSSSRDDEALSAIQADRSGHPDSR
ncbi:MobA/MobL family protein [Xanthomonas campestris pv. campestris]|uniref:MobA/MobL family protein n=1 Tax=Xanthomonas campestris TaxID=339 RepID=UPI002AD57D14|nr:MobA/MobL family protein [Xanthomonas campestris]MEA0624158.1 MobA/MobL family protein [Xanthomonas campestris pv. campestris]MEA0664895.1 MobA/MobL family protein [Xanthomonas campestris pv. campestris]MEA0673702.1 MobA/MobL family protein [Xanthomonas campestris pv. campestris]MEA0704975.1 MobA/MobL family protein [Xanthomonas campestris pv. campestris]MEA0723393.1 MobA/MobL family protein [Xanthomonas campestris pv. campestris]